MKQPRDSEILIVDDEVYMREIIRYDLEKIGYSVSEAGCGKDAFEMIKTKDFDAVLSDVRMPQGTGIELLKWIKDWNPISPNFIFMTAFSDISADEALDQGAEDFLTKPLERSVLFDIVAKAVVGREERWKAATDEFQGCRHVRIDADNWLNQEIPYVCFGTGGFFLQMHDGFPESLEIIGFKIPAGVLGSAPFEGYGRVRWVRHEETEEFHAGIGVELVSLSEDSRKDYLAYLSKHKKISYVPLGSKLKS